MIKHNVMMKYFKVYFNSKNDFKILRELFFKQNYMKNMYESVINVIDIFMNKFQMKNNIIPS